MSLRSVVGLALGVVSLTVPVVRADNAVAVVVNSQNPGVQIKRDVLKAIFLRQALRWNDGKLVDPVDQSTRSATRAAFSEQVLGTSLPAIQTYWLNALAKGIAPPAVKAGDDEVLAFVKVHPDGIGYVSAATPLDASVKAIKVVD